MTGTGTQADPYIVDGWEELISVSTVNTVWIKMADSANKVIDFNDIYPDGLQDNVKLLGYIDFNGWTLKNLYISTENKSKEITIGSAAQTDYTIKNLNFENFLKRSEGDVFTLLGGYGTFYNCTFSGEFDNEGSSANNAYLGYYVSYYDCSMNFYNNSTGRFRLSYSGRAENCHVHLEGKMYDFSPNSLTFYNSLITGEIETINSISINPNYGAMYYSVWDIAANGTIKGYLVSGTTIFNSDKISKDSSDSSQNLIGVTTEQMKNADYLRSIGFPIGVE